MCVRNEQYLAYTDTAVTDQCISIMFVTCHHRVHIIFDEQGISLKSPNILGIHMQSTFLKQELYKLYITVKREPSFQQAICYLSFSNHQLSKGETREGVKPQGCKIKVRAVRLCYSLVGHLCSWTMSALPVCQQLYCPTITLHCERTTILI